ncbi:hypothetical protein RRG08_040677 [Elysia crispata]|uniref:Chitin-binding type-2 domain-containing protein n=1 Tax=Elysia crispata TaxID=231223 RepID=A0AAE0YXV5_9GAST|nr:hypothetical protein RRG08_040677 [Elysia crispata]
MPFVTHPGICVASAQLNLCPAPDGDFPNPASEGCTTFFRCANNQATMLRCPAMQTFDFLFRSCRRGTQLQCERWVSRDWCFDQCVIT